ncbi:hypothetical protein Bpfe_012191 [Biomphalaria pfeifferi]|uniref:Uncharacterized protein n=1 Tax=Biomphalaria pfeifferi TaxID=112525 RepID=A0AAD8FCX0_BIOPF|nr:hypothetical protein Bpfe_012191 [Biomphalaria pfeifferi]
MYCRPVRVLLVQSERETFMRLPPLDPAVMARLYISIWLGVGRSFYYNNHQNVQKYTGLCVCERERGANL